MQRESRLDYKRRSEADREERFKVHVRIGKARRCDILNKMRSTYEIDVIIPPQQLDDKDIQLRFQCEMNRIVNAVSDKQYNDIGANLLLLTQLTQKEEHVALVIDMIISTHFIGIIYECLVCTSVKSIRSTCLHLLSNLSISTTNNNNNKNSLSSHVVSSKSFKLHVSDLKNIHSTDIDILHTLQVICNSINSTLECDFMLMNGIVEVMIYIHNRNLYPAAVMRIISNLCKTYHTSGNGLLQFARFNLQIPLISLASDAIRLARDTDSIRLACWALRYLTDDYSNQNSQIEVIINTSIPKQLIELIRINSTDEAAPVIRPAIECLANICSGQIHHVTSLVRLGLVDELQPHFNNPSAKVRVAVCYAFENLLGGGSQSVAAVLTPSFVRKMVHMMSQDVDIVKRAAGYVVANVPLTKLGSSLLIKELSLPLAIVKLLRGSNPRICLKMLQLAHELLQHDSSFQVNLESAGFVDACDILVYCPTFGIYTLSETILDTYFSDNIRDDENDDDDNDENNKNDNEGGTNSPLNLNFMNL